MASLDFPNPQKVLLLGGTQFVGRTLVTKLLATPGYEVTLYNRQLTNADLFPTAHKIKGDRTSDDFSSLANQHWDIVIDFSAYYPVALQALLNQLKGKVARYIFISTISVYDLEARPGANIAEDFPLYAFPGDENDAHYGQRKTECERVLQAAGIPELIIFRPSLIYGRYDHSDRFYYWLWRMKTQERILLAAETPDLQANTYAADFAELIFRAMTIEKHATIYNATTHVPLSIAAMLDVMKEVLGREPQIIPIPGQALLDQGVKPGSDLPLWYHENLLIDNALLARDFGFEFTPFAASLAETAAYYEQLGWPKPKAGMTTEKEMELLENLR